MSKTGRQSAPTTHVHKTPDFLRDGNGGMNRVGERGGESLLCDPIVDLSYDYIGGREDGRENSPNKSGG